MATQLIPVFNGTINNESVLLCDARELHNFLGVGKRFASWITERIEQYGFVENQDYIIASQNREANMRGGHNRKDYHLTLDTAKETAMVERNEKGRQIRRYFIECEKQLRQQEKKQSKPTVRGGLPSFRYLVRLTYIDTETGIEETFSGGANFPSEIIQGTAKHFGIYVPEMIAMPVNAFL